MSCLTQQGYCQIETKDPLTKGMVIIMNTLINAMDGLLPEKPSRILDRIDPFYNNHEEINDLLLSRTRFYYALDSQMCRVSQTIDNDGLTSAITVYYYKKKTLKYELQYKDDDKVTRHFIIYYLNDHMIDIENKIGKQIPDPDKYLKFSYYLLNF